MIVMDTKSEKISAKITVVAIVPTNSPTLPGSRKIGRNATTVVKVEPSNGTNKWLTVPAIAAAAVLSAFLSWNEFLVASSTTREGAKVLSITVAGFVTDKGVLWGPMAAIAILIIVPPLIFALGSQKYLVRGLTGGGLKG